MELMLFKYEEMNGDGTPLFSDISSIEIEGEVWFVAADVCKALELDNVTKALYSLDDDEKLTLPLVRSGQKRTVNIINESGLYALTIKSKKEKAKKFRKWITKEVIPSIRKNGSYSIDRNAVSNFIMRYDANFDKLDNGYFSVIGELFIRLQTKLYSIGYLIPDKSFDGKEIRPDTSVGKPFPKFLEEYYPELKDRYKYYQHTFPNKKTTVKARQYENCVWEAFVDYVDNVWIPHEAERYFKERDTKALDYLPKLLVMVKPTTPKGLLKKVEESKKKRLNDDFDKGIDDILGYEPKED